MQLFPKPIIEKLAANGRANAERMADDGDTHDFFPVVKLFMPDGAGTWLLTEIDPDEPFRHPGGKIRFHTGTQVRSIAGD